MDFKNIKKEYIIAGAIVTGASLTGIVLALLKRRSTKQRNEEIK